jgi:TM2 domain-containing membrane protein YozV
MTDIIIPVALSLFLGPGMGQLYNKEYKKGGYLIGVSLLVLGAALVWFSKALKLYLTDVSAIDKDALQPMIQNAVQHVMEGQGHTFMMYQVILCGLWAYSVIDAYLGAQKRQRASKQAAS